MSEQVVKKRRIGRPRTVSLEPEEMIKMGEYMLSWIEENSPMHISEYYSSHMGISKSDFDTMSKRPEFVPYYDIAMREIALQYINGTVNPSISHRFLRYYFSEVRDEEDAESRFKSSLKKQENEALVGAREAMEEIVNKSESAIKKS
jgi:hypothetical protein